MAITWIAFCTTCGKEIESCKNGAWADAAAVRHKTDMPEHDILVGYRVKVKNEGLVIAEGLAKDFE